MSTRFIHPVWFPHRQLLSMYKCKVLIVSHGFGTGIVFFFFLTDFDRCVTHSKRNAAIFPTKTNYGHFVPSNKYPNRTTNPSCFFFSSLLSLTIIHMNDRVRSMHFSDRFRTVYFVGVTWRFRRKTHFTKFMSIHVLVDFKLTSAYYRVLF